MNSMERDFCAPDWTYYHQRRVRDVRIITVRYMLLPKLVDLSFGERWPNVLPISTLSSFAIIN